MHHGYSSYLETLDVEGMEQFYKDMNLLIDSYTRFHKLPDQLKSLGETDLKIRLAKAFETKLKNIDLKKESPLNYDAYTYRFSVSGNFDGLIDGLNGQIREIHGLSRTLSDGPILSKAKAEEIAKGYIEMIYGDSTNFELVPLGFNYNASSNDSRFKVYSFSLIPVVDGYKLYTPFGTESILHIDASSGKLDTFDHNRHVPSFEGILKTDTSEKVSKETLNQKSLNVRESVIIYSALSGEFKLVHMTPSSEDFQEGKFYSAITGKLEWIYFNDR